MTTHTRSSALLAFAAGGLILLAGCSSAASAAPSPASSPASSPTAAPRELTIAHVDGDNALEPATGWFAEALAERSGGALTASFTFKCCGSEANVEQALIDKVASGQADLGWVGVRALHDAGTAALDPFLDPMLVTSYDAEQAILQSDDAHTALSALADVGVQGLGLVPGSMRYPLSAGLPLDDASTWPGLRFYSFASAVGFDTLGAVGVNALSMGFDERNAALASGTIDALDNSVAYQAMHTDVLPYALVNVPLSARISALIASPDLKLSDAERGWIEQAINDTVARTTELASVDQAAIESGCANGGEYATATDAELAAFRASFKPVDEKIASTGSNAALLDRLKAIAIAFPDPAAVTCEPASAAPAGSDQSPALNGSFTTISWDEKAQRAHGMPDGSIAPGAVGYGKFIFTFDNGTFRADLSDGGECDGTYIVNGNQVTVEVAASPCGQGRFFKSNFEVTDEALAFTQFESPHPPIDPILFATEPLTRVN